MITENFYSLAEGECGVPLSFDEISTVVITQPALDENGSTQTDNQGNIIFETIQPTFELTDSSFVILEFKVVDSYPSDTDISIVPSSYEIQKPKKFTPQTTIRIKSAYDFGAQVLVQLNIKDRFNQILYTDYQIIVIGDAQQRNCKKITESSRNSENIILDIHNNWKYIHNDHLIAKLYISNDDIDKKVTLAKLTKKSKDILPIRRSCEDISCSGISSSGVSSSGTSPSEESANDCFDPVTSCRSRQISEIPGVSIIKRSVADSYHKIGELIYKKNIYENDMLTVEINDNTNIPMSGIISSNGTNVKGDYYTQHLLSYDQDNLTNTVQLVTPDQNNNNQELVVNSEDLLLDAQNENNTQPQSLLLFNNKAYDRNRYIAYSSGVYVISIPRNISMALLNRSFEEKISYRPINDGYITTRELVDNNNSFNQQYIPPLIAGEYDFITGDMEITVSEGVEDYFLSFYILHYGYAGTAEKIIYSKQYVPTPTPTPSNTPTPAPTHTPTTTSTPSVTPSITPTHTPTQSITPTITTTVSPSPTHTNTPTSTPTITHTPSPTPTNTPTISVTPTNTPTISTTPTNTPTISITPSNTPTVTTTPTNTPTNTPTVSNTPTISPTISLTPSNTPTVSFTPSITPTNTMTPTPTVTPSQNIDLPARSQNISASKNIENNTIDISWEAPLYSGTTAIVSYTITYQKVGDSNFIRQDNISNTIYSIIFDNPNDIDDSWIIQIRALNQIGFGLPAEIVV